MSNFISPQLREYDVEELIELLSIDESELEVYNALLLKDGSFVFTYLAS